MSDETIETPVEPTEGTVAPEVESTEGTAEVAPEAETEATEPVAAPVQE